VAASDILSGRRVGAVRFCSPAPPLRCLCTHRWTDGSRQGLLRVMSLGSVHARAGVILMACTAPRLFRHRTTYQYWVAACTRWACAGCLRRVALGWKQVLNWAAQNGPVSQYLITLTLREPLPLWRQASADLQQERQEQAVALAHKLTRALSRLVEEIRTKYGSFEYLAMVELTTGRRTPGHRPHLHLLARGPLLPTRWLSDRWRFHTKGSFKVDIQKLKSPRQAGDYLMGYTVAARKQAQREHLTDWPGPRIRYSRGFFPLPAAQIRALLWPPSTASGMWEFVGMANNHFQVVWELPHANGCDPPEDAAHGLQPMKYRKVRHEAGAKPCGEDRPRVWVAQAQVSLPTSGYNADCRLPCNGSVFAL
jgi:hypothetical protein